MLRNLARQFSTGAIVRSNIGRQPIKLSEGSLVIEEKIPYEFCKSFSKGKNTFILNKQFLVKGSKGILKMAVPEFVNLNIDNGNVEVLVKEPENKIQRSMWGTTRALLNNHIIGTSEGHLAIVKFVGTGYRASLEEENGKKLIALKIGFPYIPKLQIPEGLTVTIPNPTRVLIEGTDKQQVKLFAAVIREHKKPEPYKGKGIYVDDETIKLKEKKVK